MRARMMSAVRMRRVYLVLVSAAACAGVLLVGSAAQSQTPTGIVATDNEFKTFNGEDPALTLPAGGGTVIFQQTGVNKHNVVFKAAQPASCEQTGGTPSGPVPPLPNQPSNAAWIGTCTFTAPGTYTFYCAFHGEAMNGSVTVPGGTTPPPPPPVSPPPPPPPPPPAPTGAAASGLRVTTPQRSFTLRGSVQVRSAGSRLLARAFAKRRSLSGGRSNLLVQVGRQQRSSVGATRVSFGVPLSALARRALRRNGRLAITFRLTVTPPSGAAYTATRAVILRAP
jgi:plastocyanin